MMQKKMFCLCAALLFTFVAMTAANAQTAACQCQACQCQACAQCTAPCAPCTHHHAPYAYPYYYAMPVVYRAPLCRWFRPVVAYPYAYPYYGCGYRPYGCRW